MFVAGCILMSGHVCMLWCMSLCMPFVVCVNAFLCMLQEGAFVTFKKETILSSCKVAFDHHKQALYVIVCKEHARETNASKEQSQDRHHTLPSWWRAQSLRSAPSSGVDRKSTRTAAS